MLLPVPVTQGENLLRAPLSDTKTDIMQVLDAIPSGTLTLGGAVPFGQDAPESKPRSLTSKLDLLPQTIACAMEGRQIQPILAGDM